VDPFTLALGRRLLKSARLSLPNLLLNEDIFPEWVGRRSDLTNPNFAGLMLTLQGLELDWPSLKSRIDSLLGPESGAKIAAQEGFRLLNT
jgi:lipid A disaccharide synthetase